MNDELDALRSFRPEADRSDRRPQLQERIEFMETLAHAPTARTPPDAAPASAPPHPARDRHCPRDRSRHGGRDGDDSRRRPAGPRPRRRARHGRSAHPADRPGGRADVGADGRRRHARARTAPTNGGGTCAYLRQLDAAGAPADSGPISCAVSLAGGGMMGSAMGAAPAGSQRAGMTMTIGGPLGDGHLSAQLEVDATGAATLFGQAPGDVAKVEVVDAAGAVLARRTRRTAGSCSRSPRARPRRAVSLVAQSASGATIDTVPIATPAPGTPGTAGSVGSAHVSSGTASG